MAQKSAKESLNYFKVLSLSSATSSLPINKVVKSCIKRQTETWVQEFYNEFEDGPVKPLNKAALYATNNKPSPAGSRSNDFVDPETEIE